MYNRYLSGEYIPEEQSPYRQTETQEAGKDSQTTEASTQELMDTAKQKSGSDLAGLLSGFLRNLRFDTDDLLLLAIIWLLVRDSGDDDILLIVAALFVMGYFKF